MKDVLKTGGNLPGIHETWKTYLFAVLQGNTPRGRPQLVAFQSGVSHAEEKLVT